MDPTLSSAGSQDVLCVHLATSGRYEVIQTAALNSGRNECKIRGNPTWLHPGHGRVLPLPRQQSPGLLAATEDLGISLGCNHCSGYLSNKMKQRSSALDGTQIIDLPQ